MVDLVEPDLAQIILEYHHYLLKGDLGAKKDRLRKLADALEPKRKELDNLNKTLCSDFFFLVNKMNIRHNNCDPSDKSKYVEKFDKMTKVSEVSVTIKFLFYLLWKRGKMNYANKYDRNDRCINKITLE